MKDPKKKSIAFNFSEKAKNYKRRQINYNNKQDLITNMILNNMKIEGQDVTTKTFLETLKKHEQQYSRK